MIRYVEKGERDENHRRWALYYFYFYVIDDHKLRGFTKHSLDTSQFLSVRSPSVASPGSVQGLARLTMSVDRAVFALELWVPLASSFWLLTESSSLTQGD